MGIESTSQFTKTDIGLTLCFYVRTRPTKPSVTWSSRSEVNWWHTWILCGTHAGLGSSLSHFALISTQESLSKVTNASIKNHYIFP